MSCISPDARGKHLAHPGKSDIAAWGQKHSMAVDMESTATVQVLPPPSAPGWEPPHPWRSSRRARLWCLLA